jgi:hypothetical protein
MCVCIMHAVHGFARTGLQCSITDVLCPCAWSNTTAPGISSCFVEFKW